MKPTLKAPRRGSPGSCSATHARIQRVLRTTSVAWALYIVACGGPGARTSVPSPQRDVLGREEILNSTASTGDLLQAIQSLRPNFLALHPSAHSSRSAAARPLAVFIGTMRQSGIDALSSILASNVVEVRYLDPTASQNLYGLSATGGALVVTLYDPKKNPDGP